MKNILVVDDDRTIHIYLRAVLERQGFEVTSAFDGDSAWLAVQKAIPDLVISDVVMEGGSGFSFVERMRADPSTEGVPIIMITATKSPDMLVKGLDLGADDYLLKPVNPPELLARIRSKLGRPPMPARLVPREQKTGLMSERTFLEELRRELERVERGGQQACLAVLELYEAAAIRERLGIRADAAVARQAADLLRRETRPLDLLGRDAAGRFLILLPDTTAALAEVRLASLLSTLAGFDYVADEGHIRLTPYCGFVELAPEIDAATGVAGAAAALRTARGQLDLHPVQGSSAVEAQPEERLPLIPAGAIRTALQIAMTFVIGIVVPLLIYAILSELGYDITPFMYIVTVIALTFTSVMVWVEAFHALRRVEPPAEPASPYPRAAAIIAAYLPNEAPTVMDTIEAFLRVDYPEPLQIILAYNTPRALPIERELQALAARDPRFVALRVENSTSKAQNVNSAIAIVQGAFVGVFDADHHPDPDSFKRAWRWLSHGADVVQGHCAVRNGNSAPLARMIAVEFEAIYAVSHPGRARQHGFGIFGGSNGYWKTELLQRTRMQKFMLTEDIDSTMRALGNGATFVSDPLLISRELAPTGFKALWNQRMRWAQGWKQVSARHAVPLLRNDRFTARQKFGFFHLLVWREIYPWISIQIFPILLHWIFFSRQPVSWTVPIFLATTIFTLGTGPGQMYFIWKLADPTIKQHRLWLFEYLFASILYTELKNIIARVAHIKEWSNEKEWKVTPRGPGSAAE